MSAFLGGVPSGPPTAAALSLSIAEAINRALAHNLGLLLTEDGVERARGARWRALGDLMPNINGRISETSQQVNLRAFGFSLPSGFPGVVGPYQIVDARVYLSQAVLDLRATNEARAETHNVAAARYDLKTARDLVVLVAADAYSQAVAAAARTEVARAQVETAEALYTQTADMKQNGLVANIEVLRAEVQLETERQRVTAARNQFEKAKLQLARLIGLPLGQAVTLTDQISSVPLPEMTLDQAVERAYRTRPDYQAALERIHAAEAIRRAVVGDTLPSVRVNASYGDIGVSLGESHGTFSVVGAVDVPIFQGGRTRGRLLEADTDLRSRRAEAEDLKASIYYEVRTALLDLQTGNEQLQVATRVRELAANQLTEARDRFAAGVSSNIEVIQAQGAVTQANDQFISALYAINVAKGGLIHAIGIAEETARQNLGGVR